MNFFWTFFLNFDFFWILNFKILFYFKKIWIFWIFFLNFNILFEFCFILFLFINLIWIFTIITLITLICYYCHNDHIVYLMYLFRPGQPLWSYEDITSKVWSVRSAEQLDIFVQHTCRVFSESLPHSHLEER